MKKTWIFLSLLLFLIVGAILVSETQKPQTTDTKAAVKNAKLFLLPAQLNMSGEQTLQLWVTSDAPVAFARAELSFNKSLIKLSQPISLTDTDLGTTVTLTTPADASTSGKIVVAVAKDATSSASTPTGTFQLATLTFSPNTTRTNRSTSLQINTTRSQLIADDTSVFTLRAGNASILVNPTANTSITPTPTPSGNQQSLNFTVKLAGVTDGSADGAKIAVKFVNRDSMITQLSAPLSLTHTGNGVYQTTAIIANPFPAGTQLRVKIKGEKHISVQFCKQSGQTGLCADTEYITVPNPSPATLTFDFTGIPLPPGDLPSQDGQANRADFDKLTPLMSKICATLTAEEKLVGDVDYNGCVTVRDVFLILQSLETRYDE